MESKKPLEEIYGKRFFCRRHKLHWRAVPICDTLVKMWKFNSVVDVGCATGDIVNELELRGFDAWGIEGSKEVEEYIVCQNYVIFDLRERKDIAIPYKERFDLCLCLEVAEHIESEYSERFVDHLVELSDTIVISAAPPGQGGHHHVNCQPIEYWVKKFRKRGYVKNSIATDLFRHFLTPWAKKPGIKAYYGNTVVFENEDRLN